MLVFLKTHPKKGCNIDPSNFVADSPSKKTIPEFNHQCDYFSESLDPRFPDPLFQELASTLFVDAKYGHDSITGKAIT